MSGYVGQPGNKAVIAVAKEAALYGDLWSRQRYACCTLLLARQDIINCQFIHAGLAVLFQILHDTALDCSVWHMDTCKIFASCSSVDEPSSLLGCYS